jgi:hypothetical protein
MSGMVWGIISVLLAVVWIITMADLVRRHLGTGRTVAWALLVLVLPFIGALACWGLREPPAEEAQRRVDAEREMRHGGDRPPFDSTHVGS